MRDFVFKKGAVFAQLNLHYGPYQEDHRPD